MADLNIETDLLRTFATVVDSGGFTQAGERLMRGQSAVSLQIKRLEDKLGVRLLKRSPRTLALTGDGEMILDYARRILRLHDELAVRVRDPEVAGLARIGAPEDFATSHLPNVLARFAATHPRVAIEVTCELTLDILDRFRVGGLDLALVKREPSTVAGGTRVWREPLVWVAATHRLAERADALPLAVSPRPCVYRKRATDALDSVGRTWRIAYTCGSLAGTHAAVRAGLGITVLPKEMVPPDLLIFDDEASGLPDLKDTEMALLEAPQLGPAAARLGDYIVRELEHAH